MSIAVSAVVQPSRYLSGLVLLMCAGLLLLACTAVSGDIEGWPFPARILIVLACAVTVLYVLFRTVARRVWYEINISGTGQIRLSVLRAGSRAAAGAVTDESGEIAYLLPASTLWPGLLLLHLQQGRRKVIVPILPDSLERESFRALLVACRWIARHHQDTDNSHMSEN